LAFPSGDVENTNGTLFYRPTIGGRIVGGVAATIAEVPYIVAILRNGGQICGGSLIAANIVLTAAHCIAPSVIPLVSNLNIRSGSATHNSGGSRIASSSRIIHAQYRDNCPTCAPDYDIAVIFLASTAHVSPTATIRLTDTVVAAGTTAMVSGWGTTCETCAGVVSLRRVNVPIVTPASCAAVYGSIITTRTVCAGTATGGIDSCQGDSGGPLIVSQGLLGIVSFGSGCARPGVPGVYASVPGFRAWIRTNTGV